MSFPRPDPLLRLRRAPSLRTRRTLVVCPGFETRIWRYERLAAHLTDWIPEFVFRPEDLPPSIKNTTALRKLMENGVRHLYDEETTTSRGELGELLLHVACRQFCGTFPAISKLFYKTASNDIVKGFDIAHVRYSKEAGAELWLGEAKFYKNGRSAVIDALQSINAHLDAGFLKAEKALLGGKLSRDTPGYSHIRWLFDPDTSLDDIFARLVIPILIAYNSDSCRRYNDNASYDLALEREISLLDTHISGRIRDDIEIVTIYVPMDTKERLQASFNKKLLGYRT